MVQLSRGLAFRVPQQLRPNGNPGGLKPQSRVPKAASAHVRGGGLRASPATHVSRCFFSPVLPRRVFGSAVCGKTLELHFAPWWLPADCTQGLRGSQAGGAPPEDRLPKSGRRRGGPSPAAASCGQIELDPRAGGRRSSVTGRLGQSAIPLRTGSSSCPDLLPARRAGRLPRRRVRAARRSTWEMVPCPLAEGGAGSRVSSFCVPSSRRPGHWHSPWSCSYRGPASPATRVVMEGAPASTGTEPRRVERKRIQSRLGISWAERAEPATPTAPLPPPALPARCERWEDK